MCNAFDPDKFAAEVKARLVEAAPKIRKYAAHWEWPDKRVKEQGIAKDLQESLTRQGLGFFEDPRSNPVDPPDVVATGLSGQTVGLEMCELVSRDAVEMNQQGHQVYWDPDLPDIVAEIHRILSVKDGKTYLGGPFAELALVIHTAEPSIRYAELDKALKSFAFPRPKQLTKGFVLLSYDPREKGYPVIPLTFETEGSSATEVVGIDWSGGKDAARRAWVCRALGKGLELQVLEVYRVADKTKARAADGLMDYVEMEIVRPLGERWIGIDFPFSITRSVAEHLGHLSWAALVSSWTSLFPDAATFARTCTAISLRESGQKEGKRKTDRAAGAPMSPWNLRLYRQTYHGIRLLQRIVTDDQITVLPWDALNKSAIRLVEICPAATLASIEEPSRGYKGRLPTHADRRRHILQVTQEKWGVSISEPLASSVIKNKGGDGLDSVLAAVSAYHHAARLRVDQHESIRTRADPLEGHIYTAVDPGTVLGHSGI